MGQDMILSAFTFRRDSKTGWPAADFEAAHRALDAITDPALFLWEDPEFVLGENEFIEAAQRRTDDVYQVLSDITANRALARRVLNDLEGEFDGRQVGVLSIGPWKVLVAGGLSWGDDPSDAFAVFNWAWQLPTSVLTALGVQSTDDDPDAVALDKLAIGLGTASEWSSDDFEWIATVIGEVRPNPGYGDHEEYLTKFRKSRGIDPRQRPDLANYIADDTGDGPSDDSE